ncbi:MAG TPA: nuclear transport factor 2 family protein [Pyrinomonadaceae bacterium]|nr:nuclear transport factor 2 family protein [Pyrinomonadaceae bacterium]
MKRLASSAILLFLMTASVFAQTAPDAAELTKLLKDFLAGASRNDPAVHERFWADDLIYTRSAGRRVDKAEILRDLRNEPAPKPGDPKTTYTAEDIRIQQYGDTAIVAFRLVAATDSGGTVHVANLLNSGTFVKRNNKWQVVNWQSTRMPYPDQERRLQALKAATEFHEALTAGNEEKLIALTEPGFFWTDGSGHMARQEVFERLRAEKLKYGKPDPNKVTNAVFGDTAIIRGELTGEKVTYYTLIFINQLGVWRAVELQTSQ